VTEAGAETATVVTVNIALDAPAWIVTLGGTVASAVLLLVRETTAPPLGAGPFSDTLPVEGDPPITLVGLSVKEVSAGPAVCGVTASGAARVTPE
jgi:hypothetical protein